MMREKLIGRTIVDYVETSHGIVLTLDNGEKVKVVVDLEGDIGADGGWYQWGVLRINGKTVARV